MDANLTERELYERKSREEWIDILEGRTDILRRETYWTHMLTPSNNPDNPVLEEESESIMLFAEMTQLSKSSKVIDLGTGNGRNLFGLYKRGWTDLVGLDISEENLAIAKERAIRENTEIDFITGDVRDTRLESGKFDLVISTYVIMALPTLEDIKKAAYEIKRLLKPGGYLILATLGSESFDVFDDGLEQAKVRYLGKQEDIDNYLGGDVIKVLHGGPIYLSEETLKTDLFSDFEEVEKNSFFDYERSTYNPRFLLKLK